MRYIFLLCFLTVLIGCQQDVQDNNLAQNSEDYGAVQVKNSDPTETDDMDNQEKAQYLANLASGVPNVNDASALITNRGVIVSIDVDEDLDRSHVGSIKFSVLEALEHDPFGRKAIIVADADLHERLQGMGQKIEDGHPIEAISEELANITGRWMPELPLNEKQSDKADQNKQIMNEDEQQQLEEINEEQSNHQKDR
ncbi:sporulation lipoprotein, YhcN/YlaJ family [Gracilibacillus orientalis]|uniref:Sporulation lipoprotein, YhcN/YlaJ family n=1 Tax=Gracilibacillus orientalis TaxID=334253 RepID=A0A1I4MCF7_9BACI|nr:YhcN/YlaJ family sporulation lipoprotein [Gracilibacillus orientalis]SFM00695.1 sporulation lipoprotein, YhcN/YlaJ family [Gracilibacillus orientalis]